MLRISLADCIWVITITMVLGQRNDHFKDSESWDLANLHKLLSQ